MSPVENSFVGVSSPSEKEGISTVGRVTRGVSAKRSPRVSWEVETALSLLGILARVLPASLLALNSPATTATHPSDAPGMPYQVVRGGIGHAIVCCSSPLSATSRVCKAWETHRTSPCRFRVLLRVSLSWSAVV